jgi:acyl carrier protein
MLSKKDIYDVLVERLAEMFEVPEERIRPEAHLYEDLELDSIDAVDLVVKLQELTGRRVSPQEFKTVRTVSDVVDKVHALVNP